LGKPALQATLKAGLLIATALFASCATTPTPRYPGPPPGQPTAEVQLQLMGPSRNSGAALYVRGAVKCNPSTSAAVRALVGRTVEEPPLLVAASRDKAFNRVVQLPAGVPLALQFNYWRAGEDRVAPVVVFLVSGQRYVLTHEIPGYRFALTDAVTGLPALVLPLRLLHEDVKCPPA
jgi:hypothetical protein